MITSKELFDKMLEENDECTSTEMMIAFAKLHLEEFKKIALKKFDHSTNLIRTLDAYSLDNVV